MKRTYDVSGNSAGRGDKGMHEARGEARSQSSEFDTLTGMVHARLRQGIIDGQYLPDGKLRIEHLKNEFGVSSSTLREALTMLISDRLVIAEGQRGFRVKPVSEADLIDLNRMRFVLESEAIRQAIAHGDETWEGKVVSAFHVLHRAQQAMDKNIGDNDLFDEWERRHRAFHMSLFAATPSEWSNYFLGLCYQQFDRYRRMFQAIAAEHIAERVAARDVEGEHSAILEAVLARDSDQAVDLLETHLNTTIDEWSRHFARHEMKIADRLNPRRESRSTNRAR